MSSILSFLPRVYAMTEEEERRSGVERRGSGWNDPRTYIAILGIILAICTTILGYIASQLQDIRTSVQIVLTDTNRQDERLKALQDRVGKLESDMNTQMKAYNFNFSTRLAKVEAKAGIKQPVKDEE